MLRWSGDTTTLVICAHRTPTASAHDTPASPTHATARDARQPERNKMCRQKERERVESGPEGGAETDRPRVADADGLRLALVVVPELDDLVAAAADEELAAAGDVERVDFGARGA
eukprot:2013446-Rhodomonas_salina.1